MSLARLENGFVRQTSAINTNSTSTSAQARLDKETTVKTVQEVFAQSLGNGIVGGATQAAAVRGANYAAQAYALYLKGQTKPGSSQANGVEYIGTQIPIDYKFNLPPHQWSLPIRPSAMDTTFVGAQTVYENDSFHGYRRGRIWYWQTAGSVSEIDEKTGTATSAAEAAKKKAGGTSAEKNILDREYGFQFLWNPESIQTNVARNMDITPSSADTLRVVAGVFPGQETLSLSIILDRTNDFAYAKAQGTGSSDYYTTGFPKAAKQNFNDQLKTLLAQGTMADIEYLFRAINGAGTGDKQWTTLLGKKTANVGYLQPTLLGIALGPDTHNNLSYVGWISNISINHTAFTETMIPLRTQVSISIECFSGSGISAGS